MNHSLESLSALSDVALDIEVALVKGSAWMSSLQFEEHGAYDPDIHPASDARGALKLLDEMEAAKPDFHYYEPFSLNFQREPKYGIRYYELLSVDPIRENVKWTVIVPGVPSVALPRAITIAFILSKQNVSETALNGK